MFILHSHITCPPFPPSMLMAGLGELVTREEDEVEGSCRSAGTPDSRLPDLTALLCLEPPSPPDGPSLPAGLGSIAEDAANMEHGPSRPTVLSPPADTRGGGSPGGREVASPLGLLLEPPPGKAVAGLG